VFESFKKRSLVDDVYIDKAFNTATKILLKVLEASGFVELLLSRFDSSFN